MSIGHFPIVPFCFAAIGDLFTPSDPRATLHLSETEMQALQDDVESPDPFDPFAIGRMRSAVESANLAVREYALHRPDEARALRKQSGRVHEAERGRPRAEG